MLRYSDRRAVMIRQLHGIPVTGVEATLLALSHRMDGEEFEVACEDARRRRLTLERLRERALRRHRVAEQRREVKELDELARARYIAPVPGFERSSE